LPCRSGVSRDRAVSVSRRLSFEGCENKASARKRAGNFLLAPQKKVTKEKRICAKLPCEFDACAGIFR
ncbi:hypothetical protein, partial [Lysobacter antibioticus]|uniref:hypothetical protein n=1 Tax=Lysobacter antibioticus TaxID=84531 RepID=UPI001C962876